MDNSTSDTRTLFDELKPGDRIEVERTVAAGQQSRTALTKGTVVRTEHRWHGPHTRESDDGVPGDTILLEMPDGELTSIGVDESTVLRRV